MAIGVFNPYLATLGGGERSTLAFASALQAKHGGPVVLYALSPAPTLDTLRAAFGFALDGFAIVTEPTIDELGASVRRARHRYFVNHCHGSTLPNPAAFGVYAMMFPDVGDSDHFRTYDAILCNSEFTASYTRRYHPAVASKVQVLYPPIRDSEHARVAKSWRRIAHVGRFCSGGHDKKQLEIATIVRGLNLGLPSKDALQLVCCGRVNERAYFERCLREATPDTGFIEDPSEAEVDATLAGAGLYVQATGLGSAPGNAPERCEHFGLALVEAMAHGCVPLAYARGGPVELIRHGVNGFLFESPEDLRAQLLLAARLPERVLSRMSDAAREVGARFGYASFASRLAGLTSHLDGPVRETRIDPASRRHAA